MWRIDVTSTWQINKAAKIISIGIIMKNSKIIKLAAI